MTPAGSLAGRGHGPLTDFVQRGAAAAAGHDTSSARMVFQSVDVSDR